MEDRRRYDIIEFVKEIAPKMDFNGINMKELAVKKEEIREAINEANNRELSNEEQEAVDFLETLLDIELGEETIPESTIKNPVDGAIDLFNEDLDLLITLGVHPLAGSIITTIRGGGNYEARLEASSNAWENRENGSRNNRASMER